MIDRQELAEFMGRIKGREDVTIRSCKAASGGVKALVYSGFDRCFHVTVDGRERMCTDIPDTVCQFFNGLSPG